MDSQSRRPDTNRIFVDPPDEGRISIGSKLPIKECDAHHLINVLRLKNGASLVAVCTRTGEEFDALLLKTTSTAVQIIGELQAVRPPGCVRSIAFPLCKGKKNDLVCEKATELGVETILFWAAERSVVRPAPDGETRRMERWRKIAESAAKQCRSPQIPEIKFLRNSNELIEYYQTTTETESLKIVMALTPEAKLLRNLATSLAGVHLLLGPEGDLTPRELADFIDNGFLPASLGPYTLRAETAAIAAIATAQGLWGFHT